MGEVYKARDPRLDRTVALKVLPAHITERADLRERFEREARAIAAFNHPHICIVHDVGRHDDIDYLVMEYLEGETLADRIAKGPLPIEQLVTYGIQIADALDKAHRHGVTHRDLKPGNIMITKTGVKLLDFGLAKVQEPVATFGSASIVPTIATAGQPLTVQGTILGTLQYMSPEQLEGKEADARADIFAFGSVLYEMATGRRAFEGKSHVSLMAAILEHDPPPVSSLQSLSPPRFDDVVRICLAKNPDERWQSAADLVHELKLVAQHKTVTAPPPKGIGRRERIIWAGALAAATVAGIVLIWFARQRVEPARVSFEVRADSVGVNAPLMLALSPDGRNLIAAVDEGSTTRLWLRPIDRVTGIPLRGTEGSVSRAFWSPDGHRFGFFADSKLKIGDISGAPPQALADTPSAFGGTWNHEGTILYAPTPGGLFRIAASGGEPVQVTELNASRTEIAHRLPHFLPDGNHFLYFVSSSKTESSGVYLGALDSKDTTRLFQSTSMAQFAPPDLLLFMRESTLMAQRFDSNRLVLSGDPFQVAENVATNPLNGSAGFTVAGTGALAYRTGGVRQGRRLTWISRSGEVEGTVSTPAAYSNVDVDPTGKRLAVFNPERGGDIWIIDVERATNTRFTFDPGSDRTPVWSPDGAQIAFTSDRNGGVTNIYAKASTLIGEERLLFESRNNKLVTDWSPDGRYLLYEETDPKTKNDIWALPLFGDRKPIRLLSSPANEYAPAFSPDGRWIAYASDESGSFHVYVQGFPEPRGKWQISTGALGTFPRWSRDGKELFYDGSGELMAVDVSATESGFRTETPRELFSALRGIGVHNFDVAPDGRRFLVITEGLETSNAPIVVVLNWMSGFAR
jgi:Tol biopolymer transport system component